MKLWQKAPVLALILSLGLAQLARADITKAGDPASIRVKYGRGQATVSLQYCVSPKNGGTCTRIGLKNAYPTSELVRLKRHADNWTTGSFLSIIGIPLSFLYVKESKALELVLSQDARLGKNVELDPNLFPSTQRFKFYLELALDPQQATGEDISDIALIEAVESHDVKSVMRKLAAGAQIEARDPFLETPLMVAAGNCDLPMVQALLEQGASVTATDKRGDTALSLAKDLCSDQRELLSALENVTR